ncbi:DoxX family protein [Microlunatus antarcticus]|uniref:Putative oxidoreductase n=1 Tax=Microlunatus antarcticus TaxID=53388 RepID=A0A7W5JZQ5_9ACTN|nr:DoxX family protein [Microlunatus antarcticus]MBB3329126.1 putative oxidoreductase [Microlunatus antarcticus]
MSRFVSFWRSFALLVARLGLGGIMLLHGAHRYQAGIGSQVTYLAQFSTPYPKIAAYGATSFEIAGGIFLILGALTPLVGLGVLVQQVLTVVWTSYYKGPDLLNTDGTYNGGFEYSVALGLLGLLFFVFGGGVVSLDRVFRRKKPVATEDDEPTDAPETVVRPQAFPVRSSV